MKRTVIKSRLGLLITFLFIPLLSFSQGNYIRLVDTEGDTTRIQGLKLRYSGSTQPGSTLKINDTIIKVYPSGAFGAFLEYKPGLNKVDLVSENAKYGNATKTIWVECMVSSPEKTTTDFAIEYVRLIPDQDQSLVTGDVVNVKVKAQPGNIVRVEGKRLFELPDSVTGGVSGIYQGQYRIGENDTFALAGVKAEMINSQGVSISATSKSLLSINSREFNRFARTTGKMTALYMGLGTDRLGGAKFGFLDTAVVVKVTGRTGDMDRIKLADGETGWINKSNIALLPEGYIVPTPILSSSFMISGKDDFDYVKMYIPERVPYTSNLEINPNRIELDIYGVSSNTNWITQLNSAKEIKNVYYRQISHDVLRVTIELNHKQAWGYSVYYENRYLVVKVKHQPVKLKLSDITVALDAGHGGGNDGAWGSTGLLEKNVNLQIVLKLKKVLEKRGAKVILTRSDDSEIPTINRWVSLVPQNPDILLSIHNNSIGNSDPLESKGVSTYYKYIGFRPLSLCMYKELLKSGLSENGNTGSFNFTLNSPTEFVNALLEVAFMSNPEDEMKLMDDKFLDKIVDHVIAGLEDFLREAGK
jgi:N-acetylmuramoyl-L-alanine amidase